MSEAGLITVTQVRVSGDLGSRPGAAHRARRDRAQKQREAAQGAEERVGLSAARSSGGRSTRRRRRSCASPSTRPTRAPIASRRCCARSPARSPARRRNDRALDEVVALVRAGGGFSCTAHARPDGDALGSMLATPTGCARSAKRSCSTITIRRRAAARFSRRDEVVTDPARAERRSTRPSSTTAATRACSAIDFPPREVTGPLVVLDHHASAPRLRRSGACAIRRAAAVGRDRRAPVRRARRAALPRRSPSACGARWSPTPAGSATRRPTSRPCELAGRVRARPERGAVGRSRAERRGDAGRAAAPAGARLRHARAVGRAARRVALLTLERGDARPRRRRPPSWPRGSSSYARALEGVEVGALLTVSARTACASACARKGARRRRRRRRALRRRRPPRGGGLLRARLPLADARAKLLEAIAKRRR